MRIKYVLSMLMMTAVLLSFTATGVEAGPNVSVNISGFLPAPPGVNILIDSGRPYYVQSDRRVYMERRPAKHYKKHHKKRHHKHKRHDDRGKKHGRDRH